MEQHPCGCSSVAERELPKLLMGVRFPPPALLRILLVGLMLAVTGGCTPYLGEPPGISYPAGREGIHRVARGETLWSISQHYGISVDDLARANGISNKSKIEVGQPLKIPASARGGLTRRLGAPGRGSQPERSEVLPALSASGPVPSDSGRFVWPVRGRVISIFGTRRRGTINKGIDIQARPGSEVVASRSGRVSFIHESLPGFGKTVILEHGDGFASVYAYVSEILVRQGETVTQYQRIARVGETGRTEVPALHFQIRRQQKPQNPLHYLP